MRLKRLSSGLIGTSSTRSACAVLDYLSQYSGERLPKATRNTGAFQLRAHAMGGGTLRERRVRVPVGGPPRERAFERPQIRRGSDYWMVQSREDQSGIELRRGWGIEAGRQTIAGCVLWIAWDATDKRCWRREAASAD